MRDFLAQLDLGEGSFAQIPERLGCLQIRFQQISLRSSVNCEQVEGLPSVVLTGIEVWTAFMLRQNSSSWSARGIRLATVLAQSLLPRHSRRNPLPPHHQHHPRHHSRSRNNNIIISSPSSSSAAKSSLALHHYRRQPATGLQPAAKTNHQT